MKKLLVLFAVLALAACGGGKQSSSPKSDVKETPSASADASACATVTAEGKPVLASTIQNGCMDAANNMLVTFVSFKCKDGSTFAANDYVSGRTGGTWKKGGGTGSAPGDASAYSAAVAACTR